MLQAEYDAGSGTCVRSTFICATLVGTKRVLPAAEGEAGQVRSCALCASGPVLVVQPLGSNLSLRFESPGPQSTSLNLPFTLLQKPRVEVVRCGVEPVVPKVGDIVTARVVRINPRLAAGKAAEEEEE